MARHHAQTGFFPWWYLDIQHCRRAQGPTVKLMPQNIYKITPTQLGTTRKTQSSTVSLQWRAKNRWQLPEVPLAGLKLKLPCASADCTCWKRWWKSCGDTSSALQCTAPMSKPKNLNISWAPCHWFGFVTFCCLWLHHQHKRSHCTMEQLLQDCNPFGPSACFHGNDATTPLQAQCSMLSSNVKNPNTKSESCSRQTGPAKLQGKNVELPGLASRAWLGGVVARNGFEKSSRNASFFFLRAPFGQYGPSLHLSFIYIPQSARALDQGGVEPRQAVSPKALRPWTIPLRYSVG